MQKLIRGNEHADAEALATMRNSPRNFPGTRWAAYQNHDLGHVHLGHLQFLAVGPLNTLKAPPATLPDIGAHINWRYVHVGFVDLATGRIVGESEFSLALSA